MIFVWILVWALAALLALILLLLLLCVIPIRYKMKADYDNEAIAGLPFAEPDVMFRASYLLGLVSFKYEYRPGIGGAAEWRFAGYKPRKKRKKAKKALETSQSNAPEQATPDPAPAKEFKTDNIRHESHKRQEAKDKPKGGFIKRLKETKAVLTDPRIKIIMSHILTALKRIGKALWPKYLDVSGEVGFADPASTGFFIGAYEALAGMFGLRQKIRLAGDFKADAMVIRLQAEAKGSVSVARLAAPVIRLLLQKPVRALIREYMRKEES